LKARRSLLRNSGFTVVELVVVILVLGLASAVVGLAPRASHTEVAADPFARVSRARREALTSRQPVVFTVHTSAGVPIVVLALPDGTVRADSSLGLDPLTARPLRAGQSTR
jgi:prepilin-type N-terminal cleavage/methylation domain-containing protein